MLYISYVLFVIAFTGIYNVNPSYLNTLDTLDNKNIIEYIMEQLFISPLKNKLNN